MNALALRTLSEAGVGIEAGRAEVCIGLRATGEGRGALALRLSGEMRTENSWQ
jgi:hypothetical protein